nr:hypothetical protein [Pseudomonas sp. PS01303]
MIYEWIGSKTGTKTDGITLSSLTEGKPVAFRIDAEFISGNNNGTVLAKYLIKRAAGGTSYSNALEFRVGAELVVPVITSVKDPYGKEVPNGSTITNDSVTLTGTATAGLEVNIFDGTTPKGTAAVNASGVWTRGVGGLVNGPHSLTAKGIYGSNPVSVPRTFVVAHALVPAITSVKDSKGIDIPQNGTTVDTTVTLTGTGTANRAVDIYDGTTLRDSAPINAQGIWTYTAASLSIAAHAFKAKAKYGSETESAFRTFTVAAATVPMITSVLDSKGIAIPQNGLTVESSVKVGGTATPHQTILIYNNSVSTGGFATADAQGKWDRDLVGLAQGDCNLTAVAQYGSNPVSVIWKIIVTPMVTPTITSIKDSKGVEIPHGGTTIDTSVTITGTASKGQKVDVKDGTISKDKPPANPVTGIWTLTVSGLSIAAHSFTAKAEYGAGLVSAARDVTITPTEAFEDFETVNLGQFNRLDLPMFHISTPFQGVQIQAITDSPYITGKAVRIPWGQHIECTLKTSARKVRFGYKLLDKMELKYAIYDENDVRTFGRIEPRKDHADWFEFSYEDARRIIKIFIYTDMALIKNAGFVDNITLWY